MRLFVPPRGFIPPRGLIAGEVLSRRQPRNEVPRGVMVVGRELRSRQARWSGRFRNRADAEQFIYSSLTGELWFDTALWRLPSPEWHPDYGPLEYQFTLALDGHNSGQSQTSANPSATLTTTSTNDVIVAFVFISGSASGFSVNSMSGTGISWQGSARSKLTGFQGGINDLELWYGTASGTLSTVSITANLSGGTITRSRLNVFGLSGANTGSISDPNASLPKTGSGAASSTPSLSGISTSNANDVIIAGTGTAFATIQTGGSGFTLIDSNSASGAALADEYQIVSSTQSSISAAFGTSDTAVWGMIVDAVQAPSQNFVFSDDFGGALIAQASNPIMVPYR